MKEAVKVWMGPMDGVSKVQVPCSKIRKTKVVMKGWLSSNKKKSSSVEELENRLLNIKQLSISHTIKDSSLI